MKLMWASVAPLRKLLVHCSAKLGGHAQIICVTHLPQVAAQGHQHYVVAKSTTKKSATTTVVQLTEEEKIDEIARMLGGVEKTDLSLAHAEAMLSGVESPQRDKEALSVIKSPQRHKEPSAT